MKHILEAIVVAGGKPLFVGGCVRDKILRLESKDIDIEVYGLPVDQLVAVLSKFGKVNVVGASFGVIKLTTADDDFDFSLPRLDSKTGVGHTGFTVDVDHTLSPLEAAKRRDFTINSIAEDMDGNLIDPYGGEADLMYGVLRATSEMFAEDPLRVLRGFQFAGRFNMKVDTRTSDLCRSLLPEAETLASERIFIEWEKWALKSVKPSAGLEFLLDTDWIKLYPELDQLVRLEQDAEWHPEGWEYSVTSCDSGSTSSAMTNSVDNWSSFRQFCLSSITNNTTGPARTSTRMTQIGINCSIESFSLTLGTRSFGIEFPTIFTPTTFTSPMSFMDFIGRPTINTNKVCRIVFEVPFASMKSIVDLSINDSEIVRTIVSPIAIYMMNMLSGQQGSTDHQFHNDSMCPTTTRTIGPTDLHIVANVVDFSFLVVDDKIICAFDTTFNDDFWNIISLHNTNSFCDDIRIIVNNNKIPVIKIKKGCVFTHTGLVCDAAAEIAVRDQLDDEDRLVLMFSALCHDLGKATTTSINDQGRIIAPGHAAAGLNPTITLMQRIGFVGDNKLRRILDQVVPLVVEHMAHINIEPNDRIVKRLAVRTHPSSLKQLVRVMEADHSGRHPLPKQCPPVALQMLEIADRLAIQDEKPAKILGGRHLIDLGVEPGPIFTTIIDLAYQQQLDGDINTLDEAISFAREYLNS